MGNYETRIVIIHAGKGDKLFTTTYCDLIFTSSSIIFAKTGKNSSMVLFLGPFVWTLLAYFINMITRKDPWSLMGMLLGYLIWIIGALIYNFITLSKRNSHQKEISNKSNEDILKLTSNNYSISNNDILSIHIYKKTLSIITADEIKIFVLLGNTTAWHNKDLIKEYENTVKHAFPNKTDIYNLQGQSKYSPTSA
jgi:hypothetical protein